MRFAEDLCDIINFKAFVARKKLFYYALYIHTSLTRRQNKVASECYDH